MTPKKSLGDFTTDFIDDLLNFEGYWRRCNEKDPDEFPIKLGRADWIEQFDIWRERQMMSDFQEAANKLSPIIEKNEL